MCCALMPRTASSRRTRHIREGSYQTDALCVSYTYVIDRATQKIIGRRLKKPDANNELCGLASDDLRLSFVKGFDEVQQLSRERAPNTWSLVAATAFVLLMLAWLLRVIRRASVPLEP